MATITIHMGMPKTGTSVLQRALASSTAALAQNRILYPEELRAGDAKAHHYITDVIRSNDGDWGAFLIKVQEFLRRNSDIDTVLSSEAFTNCLARRSYPKLLEFLSVCGSTHEVRSVMSLRRMESFMESMYLHSVKVGNSRVTPSEYLEVRDGWIRQLFGQLSAIRTAGVLRSLNFYKYKKTPEFNSDLLKAMGVAVNCEYPIEEYRNCRLGLKAQTILFHWDDLAAECEFKTPRRALVKALELGNVTLSDEKHDFSIFTSPQRSHLRELALASASEHGISEYCEYFSLDVFREVEFCTLSRDNLAREDIAVLREFSSRARFRNCAE